MSAVATRSGVQARIEAMPPIMSTQVATAPSSGSPEPVRIASVTGKKPSRVPSGLRSISIPNSPSTWSDGG